VKSSPLQMPCLPLWMVLHMRNSRAEQIRLGPLPHMGRKLSTQESRDKGWPMRPTSNVGVAGHEQCPQWNAQCGAGGQQQAQVRGQRKRGEQEQHGRGAQHEAHVGARANGGIEHLRSLPLPSSSGEGGKQPMFL
jgi:hypothetical protein